jgi:hypothetical protein
MARDYLDVYRQPVYQGQGQAGAARRPPVASGGTGPEWASALPAHATLLGAVTGMR